jgi:aryl-alcohol dehydrogenase-like predicted oxidoreductase
VADTFVVLLRVHLFFPESGSLKSKRAELNSVKAHLRQRMADAGVTTFDTANSYTAGESERLLGKLLAGRRDEVCIATKVGNPTGEGPLDRGLGRGAIRKALDASLRRLGTDYVDLYYLHLPDGSTPLAETLAALDELVSAGKVRWIGASNYPAWELCEMRWLADRNGWQPVGTVQAMYNLLARRIEDEYAPFARRVGMATVVYNPLAGGLLTGKHRPDGAVAGTRFASARYRERYWNAQQFAAVAELAAIAADAGTDVRDLALRWLRAQPVVTTVLLGASRVEQVRANLESLESPPLDADVLARCGEVWAGLRGVAPRYDKTRMR